MHNLSLRLYEGPSKELKYNLMLSQRGMLIGVDGRLMNAQEAAAKVPLATKRSRGTALAPPMRWVWTSLRAAL